MTSSDPSRPRTRKNARMSVFPVQDKDSIIETLKASLFVEQQEKEELIEVLENIKSENQELKEHKDHLQADVHRFAYYLNAEEKQHEVTKHKLEASQATALELDGLREQMLEKVLALQAQIQQIKLMETQRRQQDEASIQVLKNSVQNLNNQNTHLHDYIDQLQHMMAEEDPEEEPMEDEALGDGEILDD